MTTRARRGSVAHLSGQMAEEAVTRVYLQDGAAIIARRWRGQSGEIDLICQQDGVLIFVEIKSATTHDQAAARLLPAQMARICQAALEFCAARPQGIDVDMRFDAGLVDGQGRVQVLRAAFGG